MIYISPQPNTWYTIYQRLKSHWENDNKKGVPPPMALVLSGWTMSNDYDKQTRWEETMKWADQNNCRYLVPDLKEDEKYYVKELSSYRPYEYYTFDSKYKPSVEEVNTAMRNLLANWQSLLDEDFSANTKPLVFSGDKSRRLVVEYKPDYKPPWGSWANHLANGRPSKFTELRQKVNEIIQPLAIDHIKFKESK